tara:strand:- start:1122 stop:1454 length:333 start_codon:yes stop_codon:yes gene_type:complete
MSNESIQNLNEELENAQSEIDTHTNELLAMAVGKDNPLKDMLVTYVGTKFDNEEVTVNMIAEAMAHEFPEFVYAFAEENFLRGYQLGLDDAYKTIGRTEGEVPTNNAEKS